MHSPSFRRTVVSAQAGQAGFSLIELMIGAGVGLIGILVIMQAFSTNESYRRSTTGAGQSQANGAIALFTLEREIKGAGYGFATPAALDCGNLLWYNNGTYSSPPGPAPGLPPLNLAPVVITKGAAGAPDSITVAYGNSGDRMIPATSAVGPDPNTVFVSENYGFKNNDLFVVTNGTGSCMMYNVTATTDAGADKLLVATTGPFNPPAGGLFPAVLTGRDVYGLGQMTVTRFAVNGTNLEMTPLFTNAPGAISTFSNVAQLLATNIVNMKAWYGKDTAGTGVLSWDAVTPTTGAGWLQVRAVRIAILSRSENYEAPEDKSALCEATIAATSISLQYYDPTPAATNPARFVIPEGARSCYRYRAFDTVIPLRNMLWRYQ